MSWTKFNSALKSIATYLVVFYCVRAFFIHFVQNKSFVYPQYPMGASFKRLIFPVRHCSGEPKNLNGMLGIDQARQLMKGKAATTLHAIPTGPNN